jgi:glycosyltransferase involved in cell wall biosynthesis
MDITIITACKADEQKDRIDLLIQSVQRQSAKLLERCEWIWIINGKFANELAVYIKASVKGLTFVKIVCEDNRLFPGQARMVGIKMASGKYICVQDSDDAMLPNRLEVQFAICENTVTDVLYSRLIHFQDNQQYRLICDKFKKTEEKSVERISKLRLALHCVPRNPSAFIRRDVFDKFCYHTSLTASEDYWLWCNILLGGGVICYCDTPLVAYRIDEKFYSRRVGVDNYNNDVLVKSFYIRGLTSFPEPVSVFIARILSSHRKFSDFWFSLIYKFFYLKI